MSLTGPEYTLSKQKRALDLSFTAALYPAYIALRMSLRTANLSSTSGLPTVQSDNRVGQNEQVFSMNKFNVTDDNKQYHSTVAKTILKLSLDELPQLGNIWAGEMSITGWRPLNETSYLEVMDTGDPHLVDEFRRWVLPTRPGVVASHSNRLHQSVILDSANERLESSIKDVRDASFLNDLRLIGNLAIGAVSPQFNR